jgi:metallo-beta-lactamase family protein
MYPVRAEILSLQGFSGHADRGELLAWLRHLRRAPQQTFVVHGEPDAADSLRVAVQNELGWRVRVPEFGEQVAL